MCVSERVGGRSFARIQRSVVGWPIVIAALATAPVGCSLPPQEGSDFEEVAAARTSFPTESIIGTTPSRMPGSVPAESGASIDGTWAEIGVGLELRTQEFRPSSERSEVRLITLRMSPEQHVFDIAYRPGQPLDLGAWQARTGAPIVFNGGYFTEEFIATGLVVAGGETFGSSYGAFAGMLAITGTGPEVRWLQQRPYDPAEQLSAALQSFPMLVLPGGTRGFDEPGGETARRTVIGQDTSGRLLLILAPDGGFTLSELSATLVNSDLALDAALNLDGGTSTGLIIDNPPLIVESFGLLPTVVTIRPR